ncbi:hypothetical protein [Paenibacillus oralis]|uniref:hypothetical protein n=1 Tax=Paenibacillus oralis TaxID=2490856 RepID=UPI002696D314
MDKGLAGKRVAITGSRKIRELSEIIERQGGEAVVRPQQGLLVLQEQGLERDLLQLLMWLPIRKFHFGFAGKF